MCEAMSFPSSVVTRTSSGIGKCVAVGIEFSSGQLVSASVFGVPGDINGPAILPGEIKPLGLSGSGEIQEQNHCDRETFWMLTHQ